MKRRCPRGMKVQSIIFSKDSFDKVEACAWARRHGFSRTEIDEKPNTLRIRQEEPSSFTSRSFRTMSFGPHVKAVIGCPRTSLRRKRKA